MLLRNKIAVIYGGAGAVGAAVAKAFAREGATVFLVGRTQATLNVVANEIITAGGTAEIAVADALDQYQVTDFLDTLFKKHGAIDISFNAISFGGVQGNALRDMHCDDFALPVINAVKSYFITATATVKLMAKKKAGVILAITANAARKPYDNIGGFGVACAAVEGFCRQLAFEEGKNGIRVVCLRSAGSPDAPGVDEVFNLHAKNAGLTREQFDTNFAERTMLKRLPKLAEVANAAVLMASDKASAITSAVVNVTCGELAD
jgi:NAD(P)-dependent dehydrogenase (short-subunit alcohol dehydrogenase family)